MAAVFLTIQFDCVSTEYGPKILSNLIQRSFKIQQKQYLLFFSRFPLASVQLW